MGWTLRLHILDRSLKATLLCEAIVCAAFIAVDSTSVLRDVLSRPDGILIGLQLFIFKLPLTVYLTCPAAALLACIVVAGRMKRDGELTAVSCAGVSWGSISVPFVACGLITCLSMALLSETLMPMSAKRLDRLMTSELRRYNVLWTFYHRLPSFHRIGNRIIYLHGRPRGVSLGKVTVFEMSPDFKVSGRLDAEEAAWMGDRWIMKQAEYISFGPDGSLVYEKAEAEMEYPLRARPDEFTSVTGGPFETTYKGLKEIVRMRRIRGLETDRYVEDMNAKLSYPLSAMVGPFITAPAAALPAFSGALTRSLVAGGAIGFAYWTVQAAATVLGRAGMIEPEQAPWAANVAFCIAGLTFYLREAMRRRRRIGKKR